MRIQSVAAHSNFLLLCGTSRVHETAKHLIVTHREVVNARLGSPLHASSREGADVNLTHGHVGAQLQSAYGNGYLEIMRGVDTRVWNERENAKRESLRNPPA
jgi:hypothetical protein